MDTQIVTYGFNKQVISTFNIPITVDLTMKQVNVDEYGAIPIPGGFEEFGFYEGSYDKRFLQLIRTFNDKGKLIASICVGALPVRKNGALKNRKATTYHLKKGYR